MLDRDQRARRIILIGRGGIEGIGCATIARVTLIITDMAKAASQCAALMGIGIHNRGLLIAARITGRRYPTHHAVARCGRLGIGIGDTFGAFKPIIDGAGAHLGAIRGREGGRSRRAGVGRDIVRVAFKGHVPGGVIVGVGHGVLPVGGGMACFHQPTIAVVEGARRHGRRCIQTIDLIHLDTGRLGGGAHTPGGVDPIPGGVASAFSRQGLTCHAALHIIGVGCGLPVKVRSAHGPETKACKGARSEARAARLIQGVGGRRFQGRKRAVIGLAVRILGRIDGTARVTGNAGIGIGIIRGDVVAIGIVDHGGADLPAGGIAIGSVATIAIGIMGRAQASGQAATLTGGIALPIVTDIATTDTIARAVFGRRQRWRIDEIGATGAGFGSGDAVIPDVARLVDDLAGRAAVAALGLLRGAPIVVVGPGAGRTHALTAIAILGFADLLGQLDIADGDWVVMVERADQIAIPVAPGGVGRGSCHATGWAHRLIGAGRMLEQRRPIGVVGKRLILMPMGRIGQMPPGCIMARVRGARIGEALHLAGIVEAPAFGGIILMHLFGPIGQRDVGLGKAHKFGVVVAQVVGIILVAPVHAGHTVTTVLRYQRIAELIGIARGLGDGNIALLAALPVLGEALRRVALLGQHDVAPAHIIRRVTGIAALMAIAVEGISVIRATTRHAVGIVARQHPAKALGQAHAIAGAGEETAIVGIALAPEPAAAAIAGIPHRATVGGGIGLEARIFIGVGLGAVAIRAQGHRRAIGVHHPLDSCPGFGSAQPTADPPHVVATFDGIRPGRLRTAALEVRGKQWCGGAWITDLNIINKAPIATSIGSLVIAHIDAIDGLASDLGANVGGHQVPLIKGEVIALKAGVQLVAILIHRSGVAQRRAIAEDHIQCHTGTVIPTHQTTGGATLRVDPVGERGVGSNHDVLAGDIKELHVGIGRCGAVVHAGIEQGIGPRGARLLDLGQVQHPSHRGIFARGRVLDRRRGRLFVAHQVGAQRIPARGATGAHLHLHIIE